jgi:diaminopimelate epimerase
MYTFTKYEGLGNDFIVLDGRSESDVDERLARTLCDRHFGIGADGVLLLLPPASSTSRARLLIRNADGSRPEMCGNGIRCVALHLARVDGVSEQRYTIETDAGPKTCDVQRGGVSAEVSVAMGEAVEVGEHVHEHCGKRLSFKRISMGNPHAIVFDAGIAEAEIDGLAPELSAALEGGSNIEFVAQRGPKAFDLVVWERGVGRTLACGTGACATAAAAALSGRAPFDTPIAIALPGGPLQITVSRNTLGVSMRGPARAVFSGQVESL